MVNIEKLLIVQQSCSWPTFYQTDFMKGNDMLLKVDLDVELVKKITLKMAIGQQMREEWHDQNY